MARIDVFSGLTEFMAVAEQGSFRSAAAQLRVSAAAVSQAVKALEARVGMPLFLRTTRSVALTEAGAQLHRRLRSATGEITEALGEIDALRQRPSGVLRLSVPRIALDLVVLPVLPGFRAAYPDIKVELDVNDASVDIANEGFDAGMRVGDFVERDMVAVRLTPGFRWRVLGTPAYLARHGVPRKPEELLQHQCIGYRFPTAKTVYRWQFQNNGRPLSVDVAGGIIVNDHLTMIALARAGTGLVYTADLVAARDIKAKRLRAVLSAYCISGPGLHLYFPRRSQQQPKLRAFIDFAKQTLRARDV
ncbi:MAG TPA: LysR family transcriptional regulator [Burkholderiaceae bacterium]|nr:LysR family transcriptional regulator [Burkholderiaceae bacterium]